MPIPQRSFRYRPLYNATGSWAAKPPIASVPNGFRYMLDGSDGWGLGKVFVKVGSYWYPEGGFCVLFDGGDMQSLTYTSSAAGPVAGLVSPEYPFRELLAVPGCRLRTVARITRESPGSSYGVTFQPMAGGVLSLARRNGVTSDEIIMASGETQYSSTPFAHRSARNEASAFFVGTGTPYSTAMAEVVMPDTSAGRKLTVNLSVGVNGETIRMRDFRVEYHAGAY